MRAVRRRLLPHVPGGALLAPSSREQPTHGAPFARLSERSDSSPSLPPPSPHPFRLTVLETLALEAYRSIRFYDAVSAATAIAALGELQAPPASPDALIRALCSMMGYFEGGELVLVLEGLSKLGISHRMLTAHILKKYLRFIRATLEEQGGGEDGTQTAAQVLDKVMSLLGSMVATTQRFHTQRTTRAFLCAAESTLGPSLAAFSPSRRTNPTRSAHWDQERSACSSESSDQASVRATSTPPTRDTFPEGSGIDGRALALRVLYLFEVYRNASLVDDSAASVLPPLLSQLLLVAVPFLSAAQVHHVLGVLCPRGVDLSARRRLSGWYSAREAVCRSLQRRMERLARGLAQTKEDPPRGAVAQWHDEDGAAAREEGKCQHHQRRSHSSGRRANCTSLASSQTDAATPAAFLHRVRAGAFVDAPPPSLAVCDKGRRLRLSWSAALRDALLRVEDEPAAHQVRRRKGSYILFIQSTSSHCLEAPPRAWWRHRGGKAEMVREGYAQMTLALLLLREQQERASQRDRAAAQAELASLVTRSEALLQILLSRLTDAANEGCVAAKEQGARAIQEDEVLLLFAALALLLRAKRGGRWGEKEGQQRVGTWPRSASVSPPGPRHQHAVSGQCEPTLGRVAAALFPLWGNLVRQECARLVCAARQRAQEGVAHQPRRRMPWLSQWLPAMRGTAPDCGTMEEQQREWAVVHWHLLATALQLRRAGVDVISCVDASHLLSIAHDLSQSLSVCIEDWVRFPVSRSVEDVTMAVLRVCQALPSSECASLLAAAPFLDALLRHYQVRIEAAGPSRLLTTHDETRKRTEARREGRSPTAVLAFLPGCDVVPPVGELSLQMLECVLRLPSCAAATGATPAAPAHAPVSPSRNSALALLAALITWHPLVRQASTAVQRWQALRAGWLTEADGRRSTRAVTSGDDPFLVCGRDNFPSLAPSPSLPRDRRRHIFGPPPCEDDTASLSRARQSTPFLWRWTPLAPTPKWCSPPLSTGESVTEALMYGARRAGGWDRGRLENTLKGSSGQARLSAVEYAWQRTDAPYRSGVAMYVPAAAFEREDDNDDNDDDEAARPAAHGATVEHLFPLLLWANAPVAVSPDGARTVSLEREGFMAPTTSDVSLAALCELQRLDEVAHWATKIMAAPSPESESGGDLPAASLPSQRLSSEKLLLLRAKLLCAAAVAAHASPSVWTATSLEPGDPRAAFLPHTTRFIAEVEVHHLHSSILGGVEQEGRDAPPPHRHRESMHEVERQELQLTTATVLEAALPLLLLRVLHETSTRHTHEKPLTFGECTKVMRWLTALFPLPQGLKPLYEELHLFLHEAFAAAEPHGSSVRQPLEPRWVHGDGDPSALFPDALCQGGSDTLHSVLTRFLDAAPPVDATASTQPPPLFSSGFVEGDNVDTALRLSAGFHRAVRTLLHATANEALACRGGAAHSQATREQEALVTRRVVTTLVMYLLLTHTCQTYGPRPLPSNRLVQDQLREEVNSLVDMTHRHFRPELARIVASVGVRVSTAL